MFDMGLMKVVFYIVLISWLNITCVKTISIEALQNLLDKGNITIVKEKGKYKGCKGADGDEGKVDYPGHVDVTVDCGKTKQLGRYFVLKWTVRGERNVTITGYDITLVINKTKFHCFNRNYKERSILISEKDEEFSIYNRYQYNVKPRPIPAYRRFPLTPLNWEECYNRTQTTATQEISVIAGDGKGNISTTTTQLTPVTVGDGDDKGNTSTNTSIIYPIIGCTVGLVFLVLAFFVRKRIFGATKPSNPINPPDTHITIYISYCGLREESKNKVITFAKHLKVDNVELYLDILHQTTIDSIGGFPFWVKEKMSIADRIILILTPDYLQAIKSEDIGEETQFNQQIIKARNEYREIVELDYFNTKVNGRTKVIIVTDSKVKDSDLPQPFKNKNILRFPKKFNNNDEDFQRILGLLLGYEPFFLGPVENI